MTWHEPLAWVFGTIVAYAVATNLDWAARGAARRHRWLAPAARAAFLLGIPTAALALRVVGPEALGIARPVSVRATAAVAAAAVATLALLTVSHWWFERANGRRVAPERGALTVASVGALAIEAALLEAHWAFFRAGLLSLGTANLSLAVALAVALVGVEAWTSPWRRADLARPEGAQDLVPSAALCVLSGLVFFSTGSSVLGWGLHVAVLTGYRTVSPPTVPATATESRPVAVEPTVV